MKEEEILAVEEIRRLLKELEKFVDNQWDSISKLIPCKAPCARDVEKTYRMIKKLVPKLEAFLAQCVSRAQLKKLHNEVLNEETKLVRAVCHNILKQPMYGKKLQDTVIFHLRNFKANLEKRLEMLK